MSANQAVGSVTILTGKTLTIGNGFTLTVIGFTNNGTVNFGSGTSYYFNMVLMGILPVQTATNFRNLTINTTNSTDTVTLLIPAITISNQFRWGDINFVENKGVFNVSSSQTVTFNGSGGGINNPNTTGTSNFAVSGVNGSNEGTISCSTGRRREVL
ncbi:MAG: hypothetical protein WDM71_08415 [Ferruginibacter sp.]